MPRILVNTENLRDEASKLEQDAARNDEVLIELDTIVNGLITGWEGEAQQAFQNSYNTKRGTFKKFGDEMKGFVTFLRRFADVMEDQEKLLASMVPGRKKFVLPPGK